MDRDGTREGFDLDLTQAIVDAVTVPVIASGGVGSIDHLVDGVAIGRADAVLAASIFHFREHTVAEAKAEMAAAGITVRPVVAVASVPDDVRHSVTTERRDGVLIVHLDDGKANALSFEVIAAVNEAIGEAEADESVGALVINGRPGRFSAGFDLGVMFGDDMSAIIDLVADGGALVHRLYGCQVPVVAACTGHALAAGALVLLGCDVRVGADIDAKVGLNEVAIKMVLPDWAFTIAGERLSKRHVQRALANARITTPRGCRRCRLPRRGGARRRRCSNVPWSIASELASTLDPSAYQRTIRKLRGPVLDLMAEQVAGDRAAGRSPL